MYSAAGCRAGPAGQYRPQAYALMHHDQDHSAFQTEGTELRVAGLGVMGRVAVLPAHGARNSRDPQMTFRRRIQNEF